MTREFILTLVLSFYERFNSRSNRRALAELYTANCLGFQLGVMGQTLLSAVPRARIIRKLVVLALEKFLPPVVRRMQRHHSVYSGTVVRGDCQWILARRIVEWDAEKKKYDRPYTALSAWMAVDGSAYQGATPFPKEGIHDLLLDLTPVVDRVKEDRLSEGLPYAQAVFVAHCTDSYGKHRLKIDDFYAKKYAEGGVSTVATTPRGPADAAVCAGSLVLPRTTWRSSPLHPRVPPICLGFSAGCFRPSARLQ